MTRQGILKLANMRKRAASSIWDTATTAGKIGIILAALAVAGVGFGTGMAVSKFTAPKQTDLDNVLALYRVQRLQSDLNKQRALLARESYIYDDKDKKKKTVFGIV